MDRMGWVGRSRSASSLTPERRKRAFGCLGSTSQTTHNSRSLRLTRSAGVASSQSLPEASSNGTVGWTGSHSRSAPRSMPSHREHPAARRDVIGNDMLFRAGQVPLPAFCPCGATAPVARFRLAFERSLFYYPSGPRRPRETPICPSSGIHPTKDRECRSFSPRRITRLST